MLKFSASVLSGEAPVNDGDSLIAFTFQRQDFATHRPFRCCNATPSVDSGLTGHLLFPSPYPSLAVRQGSLFARQCFNEEVYFKKGVPDLINQALENLCNDYAIKC